VWLAPASAASTLAPCGRRAAATPKTLRHRTGRAGERAAAAWSFDGSGRVWATAGMTVWSSPALASVEGRAMLAVGNYDHTCTRSMPPPASRCGSSPPAGRSTPRPCSTAKAPHADSCGSTDRWCTRSTPRLAGRCGPFGRGLPAHLGWRPAGRALRGGTGTSTMRFSLPTGSGIAPWPTACRRAACWPWPWPTASPVASGTGRQRVERTHLRTHAGHGRLFLGSANGNVYALDAATGAVQWRKTELGRGS